MKFKKQTNKINDSVVFVLSVISLVALILDFGFKQNYWMHLITDFYYMFFGVISCIFFINEFPNKEEYGKSPRGHYLVTTISFLALAMATANTGVFVISKISDLNTITAGLIFVLTIFDLSVRLYRLNHQTMHPALVFALSFVVLICLGTLVLMTPRATVNGITFIDALFTSTSAVCVTGLAVLDTGKDFTLLGQITILTLIQLGALGMLSFTSLFALFFKGYGSYESQLNLKNMINAETLNSTFKTLFQILVFVFTVEGLGAVLIFISIDPEAEMFGEHVFFSVFHSISAFCNAGFSTLSNSLYQEGVRHNYSLHLIVCALIILGGLGNGVVINIYYYLKKWFLYWQYRLFGISWKQEKQKIKPKLGLNTKLVLYATTTLLVVGTILFYFLEDNNTLSEHSGFGKLVTSFFGSVTTRTAGFNTVDTGSLSIPTIFIFLFFMWIGASPGSTGGGIKTTTFVVALFSITQQIFGYQKIRVGYRNIPQKALQKASAIITLSILVIGLSIFLLIYLDQQLGVLPIIFEAVSAFSTVGLSMGITSQFGDLSKLVLILTMFIGRVGLLTLLTGLIRQLYTYQYSPIEYPEEEILIN
ncbi:TrkH family potassium uptake protein [Chondrinema litorale]|uniref:TrkH family potassium uptake protein n=1 Tax=Chondrinema litorale TaxID=2994555 RepID=UPI00254304AA|nr:potassium transporter TrkG [Chondrinema litorale]UZR97440.1 ATPase [Chondrinema litorale]